MLEHDLLTLKLSASFSHRTADGARWGGRSLLALLLVVGALGVARGARAEEVSGSGSASAGDRADSELLPPPPRPRYRLAMPLIGFLRASVGARVPLSGGETGGSGFDLDATIGARYDVTHGRTRLSIVPEVGYNLVALDGDLAHYGFVGGGLRYGGPWFGVSTVTDVLLGERGDDFDVGIRAGFRLEGPLGFAAIEVTYDYRGGAGEDLHALRFMLVLDAALVLMPMTLTRMGWDFGNNG